MIPIRAALIATTLCAATESYASAQQKQSSWMHPVRDEVLEQGHGTLWTSVGAVGGTLLVSPAVLLLGIVTSVVIDRTCNTDDFDARCVLPFSLVALVSASGASWGAKFAGDNPAFNASLKGAFMGLAGGALIGVGGSALLGEDLSLTSVILSFFGAPTLGAIVGNRLAQQP